MTFLISKEGYRGLDLTDRADFTVLLSGVARQNASLKFDINNDRGLFGVGNKSSLTISEQARGSMHVANYYDCGKIFIPEAGLYRVMLKLNCDLDKPMRFRQLRFCPVE